MPTPELPRRRTPLVPPHVAWPAFIVLLLLLSVGTVFGVVYASRSDGGIRLVEQAPFSR